jgi:hypothetical protein
VILRCRRLLGGSILIFIFFCGGDEIDVEMRTCC